jgi:hypothetical protein
MNTRFKVFASYNILQNLCDFIHVLIFVTVYLSIYLSFDIYVFFISCSYTVEAAQFHLDYGRNGLCIWDSIGSQPILRMVYIVHGV